ncbi:MAG: DUF1028 domain-containing protein [Halobacteriaceae archaeon]
MTFSICVRESYTPESNNDSNEDNTEYRFGVAVTTRLPGVGTLCPFASENGAVATQSRVNVELGEKGIEYINDGIAVDDALQALLNADEGRSERQLHGIDRNGKFTFSGDDCHDWYGHSSGESYTVAGNLLVGEEVITQTGRTYAESDREQDLGRRLIDALAAGHAEGGDKREERTVQSAAIIVVDSGTDNAPYHHDLRVDATDSPIEDLETVYELAKETFLSDMKEEGNNGNEEK